MTLGQLLSKRDEFWDTAPAFNGRPEIWQALRAAAECGDNDTAQAIMSAVDVTLPHGNLSLVYDELGNKYDIPPYCLSEPANLVKNDSSRLPSSGPSAQGPSAPPNASEPADAAAPALRVRLRLSTNQQVEWSGAASTNVATLKQFIQAENGIAPDRQRWLFGGQLLTNSSTLASVKVPDDAVVQIMVRSETPP